MISAHFAKFILYADDANIIITANTIEEINAKVLNLTKNLSKWVNCNGLALNLIKTQYMIFSGQKVDLPSSFWTRNAAVLCRCQRPIFFGKLYSAAACNISVGV